MRDLKIYIILASLVLVGYLVAQYNKPKVTDWSTTLNSDDKIPFGTYLLYNRIHDIFPGTAVQTFREPVYNVINDDKIENGTYIIIADDVYLDSNDYVKLQKYIGDGNDVFIAANSFNGELSKKLKVYTENDSASATRIGFINNQWKDYLYDVDKYSSNGYFAGFDTSKAVVLGRNEFHHFNYIRFPIGKGNLYLNANPQMFTNYSLLQDMGAAYSSIALSYLKNSKNLYWDKYYTQGRAGAESPMRVFLQNKSLRWSFYIAVFSLIVFVLYEMKRRQRIIPVIPPLNNTTVEFAGIVGQVYYEQHNNGNIAHKMAAYFLEHIRSAYHIPTQVFNEEFITTVSQKSGAKPELVKELADQIIYINMTTQVSDIQLIDLNRNIEQFYIQSS